MNTHAPQFADVSSATGFDFPSDTRGLAAVDWDHDGDLDVWLSNRTSPRLRFLRNEYLEQPARNTRDDRPDTRNDGHWVAIRLRGTSCNRDAIGARVTVQTSGQPAAKTTRTLRAGEGYLSQTSKWLHFGLGSETSIERVDVAWPGGPTERIDGVAVDQQFEIVQGSAVATPWTRPGAPARIARNTRVNLDEPVARPIRIVSHRRLPIPSLEYTDEQSQLKAIEPGGKNSTFVVVWATWCAPCLHELATLVSHEKQLQDAGISVVTLCVDAQPGETGIDAGIETAKSDAFQVLRRLGAVWQGGVATDPTKAKLDILQRLLVSREDPLSIPMSMMLDGDGRLAVIYKGAVPMTTLMRDAAFFSRPESDTRDSAVPMSGRWYVNPMPPDMMSLVEKLISADLPVDALQYLDRHLLPTVQAAGSRQPSSIWSPPQIANAYVRIGIQLAQRETRQGAEHAFATAIDISPDLLVARAAMANLMQVEGRVGEALQQYEEMRKRQPNNPLILNDIAWILASSDDPQIRNPAEAIALAQRACELTNHRLAPVLDTLATSFASAGQYDDAARTVEKAIELARKSGREPSITRLKEKLQQYESKRRTE